MAAQYVATTEAGAGYEGDGWSINGEYRFMPSWNLLARYDNYELDTGIDKKRTIAGVAYEYNKNVEFIANLFRITSYNVCYTKLLRVYYKSEQYLNAVHALDSAGDKGRANAGMFTLRAECYWKAEQKGSAIDALSRGSKLFPQDTTLLKQKFYYFAELNLYQAAIDAAKAYMKKMPANVADVITSYSIHYTKLYDLF